MKQLSAKIKREIARREKVWKKATPAQKRVLIAEDVLAQIKTKQMKATRGIYVSGSGTRPAFLPNLTGMRERFLTMPECHVCGLGALMVSCTLYANKATVDNLDEFNDPSPHTSFANGLHEVFSYADRRLIECCFEGWGQTGGAWRNRYKFPRANLAAIMENIIQNKGEFIPPPTA